MVRIGLRSTGHGSYQDLMNKRSLLLWTLLAVGIVVVLWRQVGGCSINDTTLGSVILNQQLRTADPGSSNNIITEYDSSPECVALPQLKPSGEFFLNSKSINQVKTLPEVSPSFFFGTAFHNANRVAYHMGDDIPYFELVKEALHATTSGKDHNNLVALDIGANQGFYTWFLATLGMQVHAFEIQQGNFDALQHGRVFNPKQVADRAHLYPVGLSSSISRVAQSGGGSYDAHIKKSDDGSILTVTLDCWAHHVQPGPLPIQFVKLDVEGFEIAVLQGAKQSLLKTKGQVRTWFMEVAPDRWNRAGISLDEGIAEMNRLQTDLFEKNYLLVRGDKECPYELATKNIKHKSPPRELQRNVKMYAIKTQKELKAILVAMNEQHSSCNFWFSNQ